MSLLVCLCGPSCSGKGEAAAYLQGKGYHWIEASTHFHELLQEEGLDNSLDTKKRFLDANPKYIIAERVVRSVSGDPEHARVCVTGFRLPEERDFLRSRISSRWVYIESPVQLRFQRSCERMREDARKSLAEFERLSVWEDELGLASLRLLCDAHVRNDASLEAFFQRLTEVLP